MDQLQLGQHHFRVWYIVLYALMIVFFCFFYTEITFNPDETADNMKQYGGFIPGIRAGSATSRYLSYVMNRLNTVGAVYLLFVALIPTVLIMALTHVQVAVRRHHHPDHRRRRP